MDSSSSGDDSSGDGPGGPDDGPGPQPARYSPPLLPPVAPGNPPAGGPSRHHGPNTAAMSSTAHHGTNGGCLHDELWCRAVVGMIQCLEQDRQDQGRPTEILSLGPRMSHSPFDYMQDVKQSTNPDFIGTVDARGFSFCDGSEIGWEGSFAPQKQHGAVFEQGAGICFFSILRMNPGAVVVPKHARGLQRDTSSMAVAALILIQPSF